MPRNRTLRKSLLWGLRAKWLYNRSSSSWPLLYSLNPNGLLRSAGMHYGPGRERSGTGCMVVAAHGTILLNRPPLSKVRLDTVARLVVSLSKWSTQCKEETEGSIRLLLRLQLSRHRILATRLCIAHESCFVVIIQPLDDEDIDNATLQLMHIAFNARGPFKSAIESAVVNARVVVEQTPTGDINMSLSRSSSRFIDDAFHTCEELQIFNQHCVQRILGSRSPVIACLRQIAALDCVTAYPSLIFCGDSPVDVSRELVTLCNDLLSSGSTTPGAVCTACVEFTWGLARPPAAFVACALPIFNCCALVPLTARSPDSNCGTKHTDLRHRLAISLKLDRRKSAVPNVKCETNTTATSSIKAIWQPLQVPA